MTNALKTLPSIGSGLSLLAGAAGGLIVLTATIPAHSAELPTTFLGAWTKSIGDTVVDGINVSARSYHEPGYNCKINSIDVKNDVSPPDRIYVVDMACAGDGPNPHAQRVREIWALPGRSAARGGPHRRQRQAHTRRYWRGWRSATHRAARRRFRSRIDTGRTGGVIGGSE